MRNLISIINGSQEIVIVGNTFYNNSVVKGLIYIESPRREYPVLIASNYF